MQNSAHREEKERDETSSSPSVAAMSQREFCEYLGEDPSNTGAKAKRRGLSTEDYLKTIAKERKGENWQRELERPNKARWLRFHE